GNVRLLVQARSGIDDSPAVDQDIHTLLTVCDAPRPRPVARAGQASNQASLPATMDITAMRQAMPKVTCGRITLCAPSTTSEAISTPRLMGPGCITMASGLAKRSFSGVSP